MLAVTNLRLHKVTSKIQAVVDAFSLEDQAKDVQDRDFFTEDMPLQRTLTVSRSKSNNSSFTFIFQVAAEQKPFTG